MSETMIQVRNPRWLNLAVYLVVVIMMIISYITLPDRLTKAAAIALLAAFGLVFAFGFRKAKAPIQIALYLIVQTVIVVALLRLSSPADIFNFLFYILTLEVVLIFPTRTAIAWIAGFYVLDSLNALWGQGSSGITSVLFYAAVFALTAIFGYALRQAELSRRENEELLEELSKTQRQLQDLAVAEERTRIAREMHDSIGHRLTVSIVQLEGAQRLIPTDPERAARMIGAMRGEMKEALDELRRTVSALRAPMGDDLPLEIALSSLSRTFQQNTGIPTHFSVSPGFPGLPETHRLALYRAAQEALTNIQRHAMAHNAWLELHADDQKIMLVMEDDGKGINHHEENGTSSGLLGLSERAAQLGGELRLGERNGGGTQVVITLPRPEKEEDP